MSLRTILLALLFSFVEGLSFEDAPRFVYDLKTFLNNVLGLQNTDMYFITSVESWQTPQYGNLVVESVLNDAHSIFQYDIDQMLELQKDSPEEPCPIHGSIVGSAINYSTFFINKNKIYKRKPLFISGRHKKLVFVYLNSTEHISKVLRVFDNSILWCDEKRDLGFYHTDTQLMFLVNTESEMDQIFSHSNVQLHPRASVLLYMKKNRKFIAYNYNYFLHRRFPVFAWGERNQLLSPQEIFRPVGDFFGHEFRVGTNLYSHHMMATRITEKEGYTKTNRYKDYWGYEYDMIEEASQRLNFSIKMMNPHDGQWGKVSSQTGEWTGAVGYVAYNKIDIAICAIFQTFSRRLIIDGTVHFSDDYLVIVAPNPKKLPQYLALINPFTVNVWLCILISIGVSSFAHYGIAKWEEYNTGENYKDWSSLNNASWFVYGTLIGESITRDTKSKNAYAIRCVIVVWLYYSFIILSAYGGELKAFLTNPRYTTPIETVQEVVESGLPWGMVLYGEEEEEIMAETEDPWLKRLWNEKILMKYIPVIDLEPVRKEKMIKIDWKSGLEPIIYVRYSTTRGDPLVHKAEMPILMYNYCGWAFYPHNKWRETFDKFLQKAKEAGLVLNWIKRTWYRMNEDFINSGGKKLNNIEVNKIAPLTMNDLQGLFYLAGLALVMDTLVFCIEAFPFRKLLARYFK